LAKLHFYYSAMNAGKTTMLLQSAYNYYERGMKTLLFVPQIDNRVGVGVVNSRIGIKADAIVLTNDTDIFILVKNAQKENKIDCVLIDEAQFLKKAQVFQLTQIANQLDIPVLAYGLRSDFQAEPFEGSKYLLAWAEQLIEIKTICHCGSKATMNMRIDKNGSKIFFGNSIEIGGNEMYVAVCRKHFENGQSKS